MNRRENVECKLYSIVTTLFEGFIFENQIFRITH